MFRLQWTHLYLTQMHIKCSKTTTVLELDKNLALYATHPVSLKFSGTMEMWWVRNSYNTTLKAGMKFWNKTCQVRDWVAWDILMPIVSHNLLCTAWSQIIMRWFLLQWNPALGHPWKAAIYDIVDTSFWFTYVCVQSKHLKCGNPHIL